MLKQTINIIIFIIFLIVSLNTQLYSSTLNNNSRSNYLTIDLNIKEFEVKYKSNKNKFLKSLNYATNSSFYSSDPYGVGLLLELFVLIPLKVGTSYLAQSHSESKQNKKQTEKVKQDISEYELDNKITINLMHHLQTKFPDLNLEISGNNQIQISNIGNMNHLIEIKLLEWDLDDCKEAYSKTDIYDYNRLSTELINYSHKFSSAQRIVNTKASEEDIKEMDRLKAALIEVVLRKKIQSELKVKLLVLDLDYNREIINKKEKYKKSKCDSLKDINTNPETIINVVSESIGEIMANTLDDLQKLNKNP